jgi:heme/copper-type cytochrome/quinol oxidase subunit 2
VQILIMSMQFGSRGMEMLMGYFDQCAVLYMSFLSSLTCVLCYVIYMWYSRSVASYYFSYDSRLELLWTVVPVVFLLVTVLHSLSVLYGLDLDRGSASCFGQVLGNQWYWSYVSPGSTELLDSRMIQSQYLPEGLPRLTMVDQPLCLPAGSTVSLEVSSVDVIHSFSIPSMGVKVDAIPGRTSHVSIVGLTSGVYSGFCAELCGSGHAVMPIQVMVY